MEYECCVCLEKCNHLTHCKHSICRGCFSKLSCVNYKKSCPICRQNIRNITNVIPRTESQKRFIKKNLKKFHR